MESRSYTVKKSLPHPHPSPTRPPPSLPASPETSPPLHPPVYHRHPQRQTTPKPHPSTLEPPLPPTTQKLALHQTPPTIRHRSSPPTSKILDPASQPRKTSHTTTAHHPHHVHQEKPHPLPQRANKNQHQTKPRIPSHQPPQPPMDTQRLPRHSMRLPQTTPAHHHPQMENPSQTAQGWAAIDINIANITMYMDGQFIKYDLRKIYHIHRAYETKRQRIQKLAKTKLKNSWKNTGTENTTEPPTSSTS